MNKKYVTPKIQVLNLRLCKILTSSDSAHTYNCPYIPETKCDLYSKFIARNSLTKVINGEPIVNADICCPYKKTCEDYQLFRKITNERQR